MALKKRTRNILIGIFIFLVLAAITFQVFIDQWLEPVIKSRLKVLIVSGSDSLYDFQLGNIDVNFWGGSVELDSLHIKVDSAHYAQREKAGTLPALTSEINLAKGSISGIGLLQIVTKKKISIGTILSKGADITLSRHYRKSKGKLKTSNDPLWKLLEPDIKAIGVDHILLNDINLNYFNADSAKAFHFKFEHCSATIDDIKIDSSATNDSSRILFTKDISVLFNNIKLQTPDALYAIESKQLRYSSQKQIVAADEFKLHPVLSHAEFYKKVGNDRDLYNLNFEKLEFINFQLPNFINRNLISADTLSLTKPQIHIYKDRTQPADMRSKYGKYPHQLLMKAPFFINVKDIKVKNGLLTYTEKNQKTSMEGKLIFQDLSGGISNITNEDEGIKINPKCVADIHGVFMNKSPIHAVFTFFQDKAETGNFEVSADMEKVNAEELNPITLPLAQASVKSFDIKELHYHIYGNERWGSGNLSMLYNNLAIELKKVDEDNGEIKKKGLLSFLVNKLVVFPDNPSNKKERKALNIRTERIPNKSFFNLVWKTLFASVKDVAIRIDALKKKK
ncbi:MAG: hypothetical protein QM764_06300 [Chitinophagaceae bacterium]